MKEAAGEANMTVITIILIGIIAAIAIPLINGLMKNTSARTCCNNVGGEFAGGKVCDTSNLTGKQAATAQNEFNACIGETGE